MTGTARQKENRHTSRATEVIAREAAQFIAREAGTESLITVIRAAAAPRGETINVFVSVFPEEKSSAALALLSRKREAFSDHLKSYARLRPLPRVDFLLDNRERSDEAGQ